MNGMDRMGEKMSRVAYGKWGTAWKAHLAPV